VSQPDYFWNAPNLYDFFSVWLFFNLSSWFLKYVFKNRAGPGQPDCLWNGSNCLNNNVWLIGWSQFNPSIFRFIQIVPEICVQKSGWWGSTRSLLKLIQSSQQKLFQIDRLEPDQPDYYWICQQCSDWQHTFFTFWNLPPRAFGLAPFQPIDWCCFYYFVINSLVALLEALCVIWW